MSTKLEERPVEQEHYVRERGLERLEELKSRRGRRQQKVQERLRDAAQSKLVWHRFKKHKIAPIALWLLILLYATALLSDFVAPHSVQQQFSEHQYNPPTLVRVIDREGSWHMPFIYETETALDPATFSYKTTIPDDAERFPVRLWVPSEEYRLLGFIPMDHRLFGTGEDAQPLLLWGSDNLGRDLFSRIVIASKVSLFVGLAGVLISFVLGVILGGISGYFGGRIDSVIQRTIDFLISIPLIPLWMALSAAIPQGWSGIQTYLAITVILSLVGWTGLARVVRGKLMSLREEDYVTAARISSSSHSKIIGKHLLPGVTSFLIVHITLAVPGMILGETTLSFLGLGITPPDVSWGTLLQAAQDVTVVANYPWLLLPAVVLVYAVVLFNFVGDGLRDAADPYSR
ncbi:ABC transporter permease [Miniimonas sp. S16]|uniref:ABC transporter permease n=1 Tax=Miniimonas sp. S16 TaxID=2171623 RepID=UPI000D529323|nr:ABC transporter permease [Miniimonas sp. S16]